MDSGNSTHLVVIQASPLCNINCTYCYLPNRSDRRRLQPHTVERIGLFLGGNDVPLRDPLVVLWHAGEPMVLGIKYYETAFRLLETALAHKVSLQHSFQTNGTLITENWCEFFDRWDVKVGVSLDGPQALNDVHRIDRQGSGTFDRTVSGLRVLKKCGIPFTLLAVLTRPSLSLASALWDFFATSGAEELAFNVEEIEGVNAESSLDYEGVEDDYKLFFETLVKLSASQPNLRIRELDNVRRYILHGNGPVRCSENTPGAILTFDVDGNCSTFSPELAGSRSATYGEFSCGNVFEDSYRSFMARKQLRRLQLEIAKGVDRCRRECEFFSVCGGGPPANKLAETGRLDATETLSCRLRVKALTEVVIRGLEDEFTLGSGPTC